MARRIGWLLVLGLCLASWTVACECGDVVGQCSEDKSCTGRICPSKQGRCACVDGQCKAVACLKDIHCATGQKCDNYKCTGGTTRCQSDVECVQQNGAGSTCNTVLGTCTTPGCKDDSSCTGGKVCCDLGDGKGNQCNFNRCLKAADCRTGGTNTCVKPLQCEGGIEASCIQGVCKCELPCGGGDCGAGKCCDASKNACVDNPAPCPGLQCPAGTDAPDPSKYTIDPKTCEFTGPKCECVKRPPLPIGVIGTHSEIGLFNNQPVISAYNQTYGDLMVGFQQADGSVNWEFVDGFPSTGTPTGDPAGPRAGIEDAGDDVGKYTSIAVAAGAVHVSYYDETNGALKYARKEGDKWSIHTVDKAGKMIGRFTSITVSNGSPVIAYFAGVNDKGESQLRVAMASSATPNAEADWKVFFVDTAPVPGCPGGCDDKKKEVCVKEGNSYSCKVPSAAADKCAPNACNKDTQACIAGKCAALSTFDPNPPLPLGTGLYPHITTRAGGGVLIAYYNSIDGDLKLAYQDGANFKQVALKTQGDVGQFPSVTEDGTGTIHVSYINNDNGDVVYLQVDNTYKVTLEETVDTGVTAGEDRPLADTSIVIDGGGVPRIVYQDAAVQAIKVASRRGPKQWEVKTLASGEDTPYTGAYGFFADQILQGNTSFISNYKVNLRDGQDDKSGIDIRKWP